MEAKPLTKEALALTEKKMDMALDDIIKMSKVKATKGKMPRVHNKSRGTFKNAAQDKSMKLRGFVNYRPSLRQGVLAQKRSNFQGNHFPLVKKVINKAAVAPFVRRAPPGGTVYSNEARGRTQVTKYMSSNSLSIAFKHQQDGGTRQWPQTLDARFANLKEERIKAAALPHPINFMTRPNGDRNAGGSRKQIPPWTRFPK
ncbi:hypothetical protein SAY87_019870 [Trapa incisa]|uniref:Uncharacterized protein n=1 Tax=Trapa incisa TaxID=236973 RepID=A0AAN7Q3L2_9MYRT|nr:hypothetical protein SAY87_019870 [Trapa incisa]